MIRFLLDRFSRDESGATAVEYGLIIALIFLAILASVNAFGDATGALFEGIKTAIGDALAG